MSLKKTTAESKQPYSLWTNNRFWLLCFSVFVAVSTVITVWTLIPSADLRIIRTQQTYGLISLVFLYVALLAAPLTKAFPRLWYKKQYLHLRRAIGVSAFFFGLLHTLIAFFGQLGGFSGLGFLSSRYAIALLLGVVALIILTAMALTSFDSIIEKMGFPRWKRLHRLIYIGGIAILIHIVMLGTHFAYGTSVIARVTLFGLLILFMLEAVRMDRWLKRRLKVLQHFGVAGMLVVHAAFLGAGFLLGRSTSLNLDSIRVHSSHETPSASHGGHQDGSAGNPSEPYVSFDPKVMVDGQTIEISTQKISFDALIFGGGIIEFNARPGLNDLKSADCFLVNQQTYTYYQGLTKILGDKIQCLPIGDRDPPGVGIYTLYLKLSYADKPNTLLFNLEITP